MTPYHFKLLYNISTLQSKVKEKDSKIAELLNEIRELYNYERYMREILDEKNKDIASLHRQLREVIEKLSKSEAWSVAEDLEINLELSEGYDGKKKESNYS